MGSHPLLNIRSYGFDKVNIFRQVEQKISDEPNALQIHEHLLPHFDLIYRCAFRLARKPQDAEDLTQEAFFYAIKNFSQLNDVAKAKNWLFSILRNLFLKELEKNKKRTHIDFDTVSNTLGSAVNLENELMKKETQLQVRQVLNKLDDRLKKPIEMFYYERMSYRDIALSLSLPMGTVMSRIARGKIYLKRELTRGRKEI